MAPNDEVCVAILSREVALNLLRGELERLSDDLIGEPRITQAFNGLEKGLRGKRSQRIVFDLQ